MTDPTRLRIENLELPLGADEEALVAAAARALGIPRERVTALSVLKRALDARKKKSSATRRGPRDRFGKGRRDPDRATGPRWSFHVVVTLAADTRTRTPPPGVRVLPYVEEPPPAAPRPRAPPERPVVVIGAGPGGLFAAWRLIESGVPCILLERGAAVRRRVIDVAKLWRDGTLDPESNPLFGEGGAGTFSDGKLYTRTRDPRIPMVFRTLVEFGAQPEILTDAHPHAM